MSDNITLLLRVSFSLTVVLVLLWVAARVLRGRADGRASDAVEVISRTPLSRNASVTVLRVADRAYVLGVTERGITQLGEQIDDLTALRVGRTPVNVESDALPNAQARHAHPARARGRNARSSASTTALSPSDVPLAPGATAGEGALAGSILAPATWRKGMDALRERTVRRG